MVSAAKAFDKEPPRRPLESLDAIAEDFQWRYVERKKTDQVIAFCADAPDFPTAVRRAVESRDANGKHHNHQSKVNIDARRLLGRRLIRAGQAGRVPLDDFDDFHDWINEHKPAGIGPVTVYDVAVRVGAFLGIEPTSVYMHAGVRQGMKAMLNALHRRNHNLLGLLVLSDWRMERIGILHFPEPLDKMKADDVEDILCTYREVFDTW